MTIGKRIKKARNGKKLTQEELAKMLGVTFAMVGQYERGERNPKKETLYRIAAALDVSFMWLLEGDKPNRLESTLDGTYKPDFNSLAWLEEGLTKLGFCNFTDEKLEMMLDAIEDMGNKLGLYYPEGIAFELEQEADNGKDN